MTYDPFPNLLKREFGRRSIHGVGSAYQKWDTIQILCGEASTTHNSYWKKAVDGA